MADDKDIKQLEDVQGVAERTRELTVTERVAAKDKNSHQELGVPTTVFVRPLPFRRWLQASKHLTGILAFLPPLDFSDPTQIAIGAMHLLGSATDDVIGILQLATDKPVDFFDRIDLDDGIKIAVAVIEVNKDFFVQKVLPLLSEIAPQAKALVEDTLGATASPSSSEPDTDTTTS